MVREVVYAVSLMVVGTFVTMVCWGLAAELQD